jgi:hypothetical protein
MFPDGPPVALLVIPAIAIAGSLVATVIIAWVGILYAQKRRELLSRERLAAIEKGLDVPVLEAPSPRARMSPLQSALILLAAGGGLNGAAVLQQNLAQPSVMGIGIILIFVGAGQLAYWILGGRTEWERQRALDEELRRAYIARLQTRASEPRSNGTSAA